jgi:hypothetical protein
VWLKECDTFIAQVMALNPAEAKKLDPLKWLQERAPLMPHLAVAMADELAEPASDAIVEAALGDGKRILTPNRDSMSVERAEQLFLSYTRHRAGKVREDGEPVPTMPGGTLDLDIIQDELSASDDDGTDAPRAVAAAPAAAAVATLGVKRPLPAPQKKTKQKRTATTTTVTLSRTTFGRGRGRGGAAGAPPAAASRRPPPLQPRPRESGLGRLLPPTPSPLPPRQLVVTAATVTTRRTRARRRRRRRRRAIRWMPSTRRHVEPAALVIVAGDS